MIIEYFQDVFRDLFDHHYARFQGRCEAGCLEYETSIRVIKLAVSSWYNGCMVDVVLTGLHKIGPSFIRLLCSPKLPNVQPDVHPGRHRINLNHARPIDFDEPDDQSRDPFAAFKERKRLEQEAQQEAARSRPCQPRTPLKHGRSRGSSCRRCSSPPPPLPTPSYMSTLPPRDPQRDPTKHLEFIRSKLTMVSEERWKLGVGYPSGHTGIDPAIAAHNQQVILAEINERKAELRRAAAENERQQAEEARMREDMELEAKIAHVVMVMQAQTAREESERRFRAAREQYMQQINGLAEFGPMMRNAIDQLEAETQVAMGTNNFDNLVRLTQEIYFQILSPIDQHFEQMKSEIPLEEEGACFLRKQWPYERLGKVHTFAQNLSGLAQEFQDLAFIIQSIAEPLNNPTPFAGLPEVKPFQQSGFRVPTVPKNYTIRGAQLGAPVPAPLPPAARFVEIPSDDDSKPGYSSFPDLLADAKPAVENNNSSVLASAAAAPPTAAGGDPSQQQKTYPSIFPGAASNPQNTTNSSPFSGTASAPQNNNTNSNFPGAPTPQNNNAPNSAPAGRSYSSLMQDTQNFSLNVPPATPFFAGSSSTSAQNTNNITPTPQPQPQAPTPTPQFTGLEKENLTLFFSAYRDDAATLLSRAQKTLVNKDTGRVITTTRTRILAALKDGVEAANGQRGLFAADHEPEIKACVVGIRKLLVGLESGEMEKKENRMLVGALDALLGVWRGETVGMFV